MAGVVQIGIPFTWLGIVLAISFLATPFARAVVAYVAFGGVKVVLLPVLGVLLIGTSL